MVTLSELLDFIAEKAIDPDSDIVVVGSRSDGSGQLELGGAGVAAVGLTNDGRLRLEVR